MSPLLVLFSGAGVAVVGLGYRVFDHFTNGRKRTEALSTKVSKEAVEAVSQVLASLRDRIKELEVQATEREKTIKLQHDRITQMEGNDERTRPPDPT